MSQPSSPAAGGAQMSVEEKYKKLVDAYKKIKQQNGLLKQAVLQARAIGGDTFFVTDLSNRGEKRLCNKKLKKKRTKRRQRNWK